jgi:hypothetical protein
VPRARDVHRRINRQPEDSLSLGARGGGRWCSIAPNSSTYRLLAQLLGQGLLMTQLKQVAAQADPEGVARAEREGASSSSAAAAAAAPVRAAASDTPARQPPPGVLPCTFWAQGKCSRGDGCVFWHDPSVPQVLSGKAAVAQLDTAASVRYSLALAAAVLGRWKLATASLDRATQLCEQAADAARRDVAMGAGGGAANTGTEDGTEGESERGGGRGTGGRAGGLAGPRVPAAGSASMTALLLP